MQTQIVKMINDFEHGRLSRRQLIAYLTGMFAASLSATIAFAEQEPGRAAPGIGKPLAARKRKLLKLLNSPKSSNSSSIITRL